MNYNTQYQRVIPRDLFNEAKLLKCMGKLCLAILDNATPVEMESHHDGEPFIIGLSDDGGLRVVNMGITIKGSFYAFKTTQNAKSNYPFYVEHDNCEYLVFNEQGEFDEEFIEFCKTAEIK